MPIFLEKVLVVTDVPKSTTEEANKNLIHKMLDLVEHFEIFLLNLQNVPSVYVQRHIFNG